MCISGETRFVSLIFKPAYYFLQKIVALSSINIVVNIYFRYILKLGLQTFNVREGSEKEVKIFQIFTFKNRTYELRIKKEYRQKGDS